MSNINFTLNQVQITLISPTNSGQFALTFLGGPNRNYLIQVSTNLTACQTVSTNLFQTNGNFHFTDTMATNFSARFYRTAAP